MLLILLSQTLPVVASDGGSDWKFWLGMTVGLVNIIFVPIITGTLKKIDRRLESSEDTLKKQNESLARLETKTTRIEQDIEQAEADLKIANRDAAKLEVESGGSVKELEVKIERTFLRKDEFNRYCERSDQQHREVMDAIRHISGGLK